MSKEIIPQLNKNKSFLNLISDKVIEIPKIQRDYAQGRLDTKTSEIRDNFLTALIEVLSQEESKPLVLDFIYGSTIDSNTFIPLDGQQRLTTLFLLHWFLIPKEELNILQVQNNENIYSRFTYETRVSSKDFCNSLVKFSKTDLIIQLNNRIKEIDEELDKNDINDNEKNNLENIKKTLGLSKIIQDQSWFLWDWRKDPTIKAILVVLDEFYERLEVDTKEEKISKWERLQNGRISFHLLPLEKFKLTDDLYVKMNARGLELSPFDIFKSSLEEQMKLNGVSEDIQDNWRNNIDSNWIDLFWNLLAKKNLLEDISYEKQKEHVNSVEVAYLVFLKGMIVYFLLNNDDWFDKFNWNEDKKIKRYIPFEYENKLLEKIKEFAVRNEISKLIPLFNKTGFFNESFFKFVIETFENLIYIEDDEKHDASDLINEVSINKKDNSLFHLFIENKKDYETWLQFYSLIQFLKYNKASDIYKDKSLRKELNSWMRIIRNLTVLTNVYIDNYDHFYSTFKAFKNWAKEIYSADGNHSVIKYFANHPKKHIPKGRLVAPQFEEEITKAKLLQDTEGNNWTKEIREIEEHAYFLGQIKFLLDWSKNDDLYVLSEFKKYKNAITNIYDDDGLNLELGNSETHLFRNCLMANNKNYLHNDDCFVNNTGKDRDRSWKNYLRSIKSIHVKNIIDKWNSTNSQGVEISINGFCKNEIFHAKSTIIDWRRCYINFPFIYNKCTKDKIVYWDKSKMEICLLETSVKWIGLNIHSELNTYYWSMLFSNDQWETHYKNSQTDNPLRVTFKKNDLFIECKFIDIDNQKFYRITSNFDIKGFNKVVNQDHWIKEFKSVDYNKVEEKLKDILL